MSKYKPHWDLTSIPHDKLKSEWARRNGAKSGEPRIKSDPATAAARERQREYRRKRRSEGKDIYNRG